MRTCDKQPFGPEGRAAVGPEGVSNHRGLFSGCETQQSGGGTQQSHGGIFRSVHSLNHIVWRAGKSRKDHPVGPSYFTDA